MADSGEYLHLSFERVGSDVLTKEERGYRGARKIKRDFLGFWKNLWSVFHSGVSVVIKPERLERKLLTLGAVSSLEEAKKLLPSFDGKRLEYSASFHDVLLFKKVSTPRGGLAYRMTSYCDIETIKTE